MWPRSGGDRGNRSAISVRGPRLERVVATIPLVTRLPASDSPTIAGGATAPDGSLRVVRSATLFAIDPASQGIRWSRDLSELTRPLSDDEQ